MNDLTRSSLADKMQSYKHELGRICVHLSNTVATTLQQGIGKF